MFKASVRLLHPVGVVLSIALASFACGAFFMSLVTGAAALGLCGCTLTAWGGSAALRTITALLDRLTAPARPSARAFHKIDAVAGARAPMPYADSSELGTDDMHPQVAAGVVGRNVVAGSVPGAAPLGDSANVEDAGSHAAAAAPAAAASGSDEAAGACDENGIDSLPASLAEANDKSPVQDGAADVVAAAPTAPNGPDATPQRQKRDARSMPSSAGKELPSGKAAANASKSPAGSHGSEPPSQASSATTTRFPGR